MVPKNYSEHKYTFIALFIYSIGYIGNIFLDFARWDFFIDTIYLLVFILLLVIFLLIMALVKEKNKIIPSIILTIFTILLIILLISFNGLIKFNNIMFLSLMFITSVPILYYIVWIIYSECKAKVNISLSETNQKPKIHKINTYIVLSMIILPFALPLAGYMITDDIIELFAIALLIDSILIIISLCLSIFTLIKYRIGLGLFLINLLAIIGGFIGILFLGAISVGV